MCLCPDIASPSPLPAKIGDGVGYSTNHLRGDSWIPVAFGDGGGDGSGIQRSPLLINLAPLKAQPERAAPDRGKMRLCLLLRTRTPLLVLSTKRSLHDSVHHHREEQDCEAAQKPWPFGRVLKRFEDFLAKTATADQRDDYHH